MTTQKASFFSLRSLIMGVIGLSAFMSGIFFSLPAQRKDFSQVVFAKASVMAEVADTPDARMKGLSGRLSLPEFGGMLFVFEKPGFAGIWMKDMKFPIDILWIRNGKVVDMKENVPPPQLGISSDLPIYYPTVPADFILEVNGGFSNSHSIQIGDRVSIELQGDAYAETQINDAGELRLVSDMSASFDAGYEYFIDTLRTRIFRGNNFQIGDLIATTKIYNKYNIFYRSGDLTISGTMNVPLEAMQEGGFPVLILNHGLIPPSEYTRGRGSKREQDFFASHGYVTIHPDYRGHASSSPNTAIHHDFYVGYTEDVTSLIDAIKRKSPSYIDSSRIGMWGHSMGGGIAARIMVLRTDIKAFVLFAPISADVEDNFFELTQEEIKWIYATYGPAKSDVYRKMSPIEYFGDVASPVQIHHGDGDDAVPFSFSQNIYNALKQHGKQAEFFMYEGEKHEFIDEWMLAANRALQFFDKYVKER